MEELYVYYEYFSTVRYEYMYGCTCVLELYKALKRQSRHNHKGERWVLYMVL